MKKGKKLNLYADVWSFAIFSFASLAILVCGYLFVPQFADDSHADEVEEEGNTVTLSVSPIDETNGYSIQVRDPGQNGVFKTIGIEASVTTANSYGYQLSMRSKDINAHFVNSNSNFSSESYISSISAPISVDIANSQYFNEKNAYGWSTDWSENGQSGTFNPLSSSDTVLKKTIAAATDEKTDIYIGTLITEDLLFGKYDGTLILTAVANSAADVSSDYTLSYNGNASDTVTNIPSSTTKSVVTSYTGPVYIPLDTATIPARTSYTFKGWDTSSRSTSPAYAYNSSDGSWTVPTYGDDGNGNTVAVVNVNTYSTTLYAIWGQTFTLNFNLAGGTDSSGTLTAGMSAEDVGSHNFTIPNVSPESNAGTFKGWATSSIATEASYQPGDIFTVRSDNPTVTLYAVYGTVTFEDAFSKANATTVGGVYRLQDMTAKICSSVSNATSGAAGDTQAISLVDTRDGNTYTVAKLLDGNCWMTENLRLGVDNSTSWSLNLTTANSDVSSTYTMEATDNNSWTGDATSADFRTGAANNGSNSYASGGYLYNYYSATAGGKGTICPKGWTIPADGVASGSFGYLLAQYNAVSSATSTTMNSSAHTSAPLNFPLGGYVDGTGSYISGNTGYLWTSSAVSAANAYAVYYGSGSGSGAALSGNSESKTNGYAVRCIASSTNGSGNANPLGEDTLNVPDNVLEVIRLIRALPNPEDITLADGEAIERLRSLYEALSDEEKAMISSELIQKYNAVLAAYYSLLEGNAANTGLIVAAAAGAAAAVTTLTTLFVVKRNKEDEESEA
ncbi:InlB B-repeat-containing protein [Candidatus Saccharibacteria bacterium]|nr:InlB B-repeat-containing protein [Candidatus Saccharibacteria bacterium]